MTVHCLDAALGNSFALYNGDCVEVMRQLPDESVHLSVFSPPFSHLYIYSESVRDMGNVSSHEEFQETYFHAAREILRLTRPGRLCCVHVKDLQQYSNSSADGTRGVYALSDATRATMERAGWTFHCRTTVWRDPVREMRKTKTDGLLYKHFRTDAARCRTGLPEYILTFRKWAPGMDDGEPIVHDPRLYPLDLWQEWASPVWMDTDETQVLNGRDAKDQTAERHICPMPLDLIRRCVLFRSNPGEVVLSPFAGIGSEGFEAIKARRRFIGVELKDSYFKTAARNLVSAEFDADAPLLFGEGDAA